MSQRMAGDQEMTTIITYYPQNNHVHPHHFPQQKLIYNWNNLPMLVKSVSEPSKFRAELKTIFLNKI